MSVLPPEEPLTDLERSFFESEPPGLFPQNQDSYWGQVRKVLSDKLQEIADLFAVFYLNQSAKTANEDMAGWEEMLGVPITPARALEERRSVVLSRLVYGAFTRTLRRGIVENFIKATFGVSTAFSVDGISITPDGITLYSGADDLTGTYNITEDIENFSYDVRILNTITVDETGLERELGRVTPGGIVFTISSTDDPVEGAFGSGAFGSGAFGE